MGTPQNGNEQAGKIALPFRRRTMAITLELPPEEEQSLRRRAEMAGQDVTTYLLQSIGLRIAPPSLSDAEWERLADEAADLIDPSIPPLSDYAVSREGIYRDHD
jgi:uncharacterized protein (DUF1778 family)